MGDGAEKIRAQNERAAAEAAAQAAFDAAVQGAVTARIDELPRPDEDALTNAFDLANNAIGEVRTAQNALRGFAETALRAVDDEDEAYAFALAAGVGDAEDAPAGGSLRGLLLFGVAAAAGYWAVRAL